MRVPTLVIACGVLLLYGNWNGVSAQEARLDTIPEPARTQVNALVVSARRDHLPTEPLIDRALEGKLKGARPDLITTAVRRLLDELRSVRQAFGENASEAELTAGVSALRAGATRTDLAKLRELRPKQSLTIAASVLADLVSAGVAADTGIAAVLSLASNAGDADYVAFRRNVERDIALGASPSSAIAARLRAAAPTFGDGLTTSSPASATPRKRKP